MHLLDECSCNDDSCTKVPGEEIEVEGNAQLSAPRSEDGEEGDGGRHNQNDKQRRYADANVSVEFVFSAIEEADDIADHVILQDSVQVDIGCCCLVESG